MWLMCMSLFVFAWVTLHELIQISHHLLNRKMFRPQLHVLLCVSHMHVTVSRQCCLYDVQSCSRCETFKSSHSWCFYFIVGKWLQMTNFNWSGRLSSSMLLQTETARAFIYFVSSSSYCTPQSAVRSFLDMPMWFYVLNYEIEHFTLH